MGIHTCGCPVRGWEQHPALLKDHSFVREPSALLLAQQEPPDPGTRKVLGTGCTPQVHAGSHVRGQGNSHLNQGQRLEHGCRITGEMFIYAHRITELLMLEKTSKIIKCNLPGSTKPQGQGPPLLTL